MSPLFKSFSFTILITTLSSTTMAYPRLFPGFSYPSPPDINPNNPPSDNPYNNPWSPNFFNNPPFPFYPYPSPPDYNSNPGYAYPPPDHTVPSSPTSYPSHSPPSPPAVSQHQEYLDAHNNVRLSLSEDDLTWDYNLASYASNYAAQRVKAGCDLVHSKGPYGENLAEGTNLSAPAAVQMWVAERKYYDHSTNRCAAGQVCGHYTQVVWKETKKVGCNRARCLDGETFFVICSYDPPGNYEGQSPY